MPLNFICPHCGRATCVADEYVGQSGPCAGCGNTVTVPYHNAVAPQRMGDDSTLRMIVPVGRSIWAIAAGYMGLISVLLLPAPFAILFGILAIRDIRKHPEKHGMGRAIFGLVMGSIFMFFLILGIIGAIMEGQRHHFR